mmetsp:Transcript_12274/g.28912  ORF Transcript_12274/g.28912 Transcript_12274/m.28912 type:complete len:100 (+) Transcript_12274:206-505(+)
MTQISSRGKCTQETQLFYFYLDFFSEYLIQRSNTEILRATDGREASDWALHNLGRDPYSCVACACFQSFEMASSNTRTNFMSDSGPRASLTRLRQAEAA